MKLQNTEQLLVDEGFTYFNEYSVGVPFYTWTVDLDIEYDRVLRLTEEITLHLIAQGITKRNELEQLLGLEDDLVAKNIVTGLFERSAIQYNGEEVQITTIGREMVKKIAARITEKFEGENIRYDPYNDYFEWAAVHKNAYKDLKDSKKAKIKLLPESGRLDSKQVNLKFDQIQEILEHEQSPTRRDENKDSIRLPDLVRLTAISDKVYYRVAVLQLWTRTKNEESEIRWRLLIAGVDETKISERLMDLEAQGEQIIPVEPQAELEIMPQGSAIQNVIDKVKTTVENEVLTTEQHRDALKNAIYAARKKLIIISPWLRASAIDTDMKKWFSDALHNHPNLEIIIGYGINTNEPDQAKREQQKRGLESLKQVREKHQTRFKLIEIGNTHEKIVVCDDQYVIVTSFNFLSNKPSKYGGLIAEMGVKTGDRKLVKDVTTKLEQVLGK